MASLRRRHDCESPVGQHSQSSDSRQCKRAARRPTAERPNANGPPLDTWPQRVAVVPYGRYSDYGSDMLMMINRGSPPGKSGQMPAFSPQDLERWACANNEHISKYHSCRSFSLSRQSSSHNRSKLVGIIGC